MIKCHHLEIDGVLLFESEIHKDSRGSFSEVYRSDSYVDFLPNNKNKVKIATRKNLEIKLALLLNTLEAQSKKGSVERVFLIISLSTSMSYSCSLLIIKSINNKTLLL